MKKSISILIILSLYFTKNIKADSDTVFVSTQGTIVQKDQAMYYRLFAKTEGGLFEFKEYDFNNNLKKIFHSGSEHATVLEGEYIEFDNTVNEATHGYYSKGYKSGEWVYYFSNSKRKKEKQIFNAPFQYYTYQYDSVNQKVESEGAISKYGKKEGLWKQYHFNSDSIKTLTNYAIGKKEGEQLEFYKNGKIKRKEIFLNNKLRKGELFDETGKKVKYFPAFTYPVYREYVSNYLQRSEECVAEALKKNDFEISIIISKEGDVLNAFIRDVENKECAENIKKALFKMKKWKPALWENNPVKFTFETKIKLYVPRE